MLAQNIHATRTHICRLPSSKYRITLSRKRSERRLRTCEFLRFHKYRTTFCHLPCRDWETAQALYGNTTIFSPMPQFSPQAVPGYFPSPNPWYMHSPIPPSPSFNPSVALQGSYPSFSAPLPLHPHLRHDFQWPQPTFTHRIIDTEDYGEAHSVYTVPTSATCASHLPDFESVFVVHPQTPTSP